ncbi:MAG TPA: type II secretion system F family protein [Thiolapillus brandeum]|uniref:Type II secretion system F family protein n=1 Tax=Thiolapillus brandeum TaxID=1076588 RepID=A0A831WFK2_9GAMM|nr:type II secretion system F family protein [Thiolapillus brandeum]
MAQASVIKPDIFAWEGTDKKGKKIKGESSATNPAMVKADLRRQGIRPLKVRKKSALFTSARKKAILPKDIAIFTRQLSTMMGAGVPLVQSFEIIGKGHENPSMQELIMTIKADVESGGTLADTLRKHPLYFDELVCNLVAAGEQAGILEGLLDKIATYKEKTEAMKAKIKKALTYPAAVVVVAFIVTAILLIFVVPTFEELFNGFGAELPAFTQMVIGLSEWMQSNWWIVILGVVGAGYGFSQGKKRSPKFAHTLDKLILKAPIFGEIVTKAIIARFARTMSTMFAAGVPLVEAMESVAGAAGNELYKEGILDMRDNVATGQQLQLTMQQTGLFPNMVVQMVAIGEESGSLDKMLGKVADFYEEEVDNAVDNLSSLLEPMIMAILGVLVGGLIIAMYLPIFKMGSVV